MGFYFESDSDSTSPYGIPNSPVDIPDSIQREADLAWLDFERSTGFTPRAGAHQFVQRPTRVQEDRNSSSDESGEYVLLNRDLEGSASTPRPPFVEVVAQSVEATPSIRAQALSPSQYINYLGHRVSSLRVLQSHQRRQARERSERLSHLPGVSASAPSPFLNSDQPGPSSSGPLSSNNTPQRIFPQVERALYVRRESTRRPDNSSTGVVSRGQADPTSQTRLRSQSG